MKWQLTPAVLRRRAGRLDGEGPFLRRIRLFGCTTDILVLLSVIMTMKITKFICSDSRTSARAHTKSR